MCVCIKLRVPFFIPSGETVEYASCTCADG